MAAKGIPDLAFEFIISGIPEGGMDEGMAEDYGDEEGSGEPGEGGQLPVNSFAQLAQNP